MDYKEEQSNEIEALESIYYGDVTVTSTEPYKFTIPVKSDEFEQNPDCGFCCSLTFTYTPTYPEEGPLIEIENPENFDVGAEDELLNHLTQQIQENIGMVMIFTLVSAAQEWLNVQWDKHKKVLDDEVERKKNEIEEAERKRYEGTKVSVESFLKWKTQFEIETGIAKRREAIEKEGKKLTGKELFIRDTTMNESDLKFLEEGEIVKVDETLFQTLDDLDFEDDSEDENYDPKKQFNESDSD